MQEEKYSFIYETSNSRKIKMFLVSLTVLILLTALSISGWIFFHESIGSSGLLESLYEIFGDDVRNLTPLGLFYISLIGSLFFIPLPLETFYFIGMLKGTAPVLSFFLIMLGQIPGHLIDYVLGSKFQGIFINLVSKKNLYKTRRWVNKYGAYAIFFTALTGLPTPVLAFALGITKYNLTRFFFYFITGSILKFLAIMGLFFLFFA